MDKPPCGGIGFREPFDSNDYDSLPEVDLDLRPTNTDFDPNQPVVLPDKEPLLVIYHDPQHGDMMPSGSWYPVAGALEDAGYKVIEPKR